ncbi:hypothetical protein AVEN_10021-1 [Araneus ventricosus]|uniref:Uncharacterized protein n=1 Tax=Araneus ventricosus TaxID=182803 RepID=A0A4Y2H657_ARAVE|nr:hypothetical protein AVEN_10021-1 [Araneus ventricosus]
MELPRPCQLAYPGLLNASRCDSSSIEACVQVAITGHDPTPPEGGTYYHRREVTSPPPLLYPPGKRDPVYLSGGFSPLKDCSPSTTGTL